MTNGETMNDTKKERIQAEIDEKKARLALLRSGVVGQNVKVLAVFADILCLDYYL